MYKLYNTEYYFVNKFKEYFSKLDYHLLLPKLNILSNFIPAIARAENITTLDISKVFHNNSFSIYIESIKKRLWRFLNNITFKGIDLFNSFIKSVISNNNVLKHNKLFICFDHMFVRNNFVILMLSLKINNQSIHIYFKCDKTKSNRHHEIDELTKKNLFSKNVIFESIEMLFKSQKTNGFNLEKTHTRNIIAFENLYSLVCIANIWLTILGVDYIENYNHYKRKFNIRYTRKYNGKFERIISNFNLGLTLFRRLYNSTINFITKCNYEIILVTSSLI